MEEMAMDPTVTRWQITGFLFTSILGTLLHFLFDASGQAITAALFSAVNESIWEHMKLLFYPMLLFAILEHRLLKDPGPYFWCVKLKGTLLGLSLIPIMFYTYNGAIGRSPDWLNISIFFISAAIAYIYEARQFKSGSEICKNPKRALVSLIGIALLFVIFTFKAPELGIFKDPLTSTYGI